MCNIFLHLLVKIIVITCADTCIFVCSQGNYLELAKITFSHIYTPSIRNAIYKIYKYVIILLLEVSI